MSLDLLRQQIDQLNEEILESLAKRLKISKEVAVVKKKHNLPIHDDKRELEQYMMLRSMAKNHALSPIVIEEIFSLIIEYSKLIQKLEVAHV